MRRTHGERATVRYQRFDIRLIDRCRARLTRLDDPVTAEDDYFRMANRNEDRLPR
jgi:hypothetical protein